jgi:hypothetical protein
MKNESSAKLPSLAVIVVVGFSNSRCVLGLILFARSVRIQIAEYAAEYVHPPDRWYALGG